MVGFAGWDMPVQYQGVIAEHLAVRSHAGLFDVSHMGEIEVRGKGALDFCQRMTANDLSRAKLFQAQYNLLLNEQGGVVDDVIFYRLQEDIFFICVNASNTDKDFSWLEQHAGGGRRGRERQRQICPAGASGPARRGHSPALDGARSRGAKVFSFRICRRRPRSAVWWHGPVTRAKTDLSFIATAPRLNVCGRL